MDKTAIKNFSIWARNKLIADIMYKAGLLGITIEGIKDALPQSTKETEFYDIGTKEPYQIVGNEIKQRRQLVEIIKKKVQDLEYSESYRNVMEEVAYTWFNRLIAIRFMEVNDYMPAHVRVLSSESGTKLEPDLVTNPFDAELEFTREEEQYILQLKNENAVNELFQFLFIRQCNALNVYLPKLFENTADYTELLLNVSVTDQDGVVYHLVHDIEEKDFNITEGGQVEIIGWMYQYYNTEPKDETFALLKKNVKITKERIPAATQLFTPDWIVRYMVENSLGRLWLEGHPNGNLKKEWKYYLDEAEQEADVAAQLAEIRKEYKDIKPEDIKIIDPCMGSGHILVYAFDVLMQIYENYGYSPRDAAKSILLHNIYGLDIDNRAFQLAYFAVMMKARQYNRRILTQGIEPKLCGIQESNGLQVDIGIGDSLMSEEHRETLRYLLDIFVDAKEYGSILEVENRDYAGFLKAWEQTAEQTAGNVVTILWYSELNEVVPTLAKQAMILTQKYDVVVTNPPYMGMGGMNEKLSVLLKERYISTKSDLSTVFMEKALNMCKINGYMAMINIPVWMFLSTYEKMRKYVVYQNTIVNMLHFGRGIFGSDFGTTAFIICKSLWNNYRGQYRRLFHKQGAVDSIGKKEQWFFEGVGTYYSVQSMYNYIPGSPVVYWASETDIKAFREGIPLGKFAPPKQGSTTGCNEKFLRLWFEVKPNSSKWFKCLKGGAYRKWYGNHDYVIDWENEGERIKKEGRQTIRNADKLFCEGISWSRVTIGASSFRVMPEGFFFESASGVCFPEHESLLYTLGLLNSKVIGSFAEMLNPTATLQSGDLARIPVIYDKNKACEIIKAVSENVNISKLEWDAYELSQDFLHHPMVGKFNNIEDAYKQWEYNSRIYFETIKKNEEFINQRFIEIYGMGCKLTSDVNDESVSIRLANKKQNIKSLLSYAVGCMFGRYSLYKDGLVYVGGEWDYSDFKYYASEYYDNGTYPKQIYRSSWFLPDEDNVIPITDEEYLEDDIVSRFCQWLKVVYGNDTLESNLDFIVSALGNKGDTNRDVIRNYFLNDFFKDHCATYSVTGSGKRPIYWLFDSGKQNGFKALIYMHRYDADTIGNLRVDYLHRVQRIYENEINRMQDMMDNSNVAREVATATKRKEKLQKQLKECQEYDEKIGHLALSRIEIELDDGVKVNYEKVQTARDGKKYQVLAKI